MKLIKRQTTNLRNLSGKGVIYDVNNQVIVDSSNVMLIPKGTNSQRPDLPTEGHVRYNTQTNEFEFYQNGTWRNLRFKEPNQNPGIVQQNLGNGDAVETIFGPLNSQDPNFPIPAAAQNILVLVENVFQIAVTNYSLIQNPIGRTEGWYIEFASAVPMGKPVTVLHNFDK